MTIPTIKHIVEGRPRYTVSQHQTVFSAVVYMSEKQVGGVAVLDGERLVGIFTERDLMKRVVARRQDPHRILVSEVMTRQLISARPSESYASCVEKMKRFNCRHLPVVLEEKLLGLVSIRDLQEVEIREKAVEIELMTGFIYSLASGSKVH